MRDAEALAAKGWVLLPEFLPGLTVKEAADQLGWIVNMEPLLAGYGPVQNLQPVHAGTTSRHHYSGVYGLDRFPLHTDFAHWAVPPRYILLRCLSGAADVATTLLPWKALLSALTVHSLQRAVLRARNRRGSSGLFRALSRQGPSEIFRWDSLFLSAINASAQELRTLMEHGPYEHQAAEVVLKCDDSLLIDNWRCMHGRTSVGQHDLHRHVQRVYMTEVSL